jgi:tryptophan-rich sensory protein
MRLKDIAALALFIFVCLVAGGIGSLFTIQSIPTWYAGLQKPVFSPPNWVFGPVWTALYVMMGVSAYIIYRKGGRKEEVRAALWIFGVQLVLNTLWSVLFFGLRSPPYGLIGIAALWIAIAATLIRFYRISKPAGFLLIPYLFWVTFAGFLNLAIMLLN